MSQQRPPQRNNRPSQQQNNQRPPQQGNQQANTQQPYSQQAPQGRPMPPQAPAPNYNQPLPQRQAPYQQPVQQAPPQKIYVEKKRNPFMMILKAIAYPFVKVAQLIGNVFAIILQELVRSIVSFVLGVLLLISFIVLVIGYGYALVQTNFNFVQAVPEMFAIFGSFFS